MKRFFCLLLALCLTPVLWSCPGRECCCPGGLPRHAHRNRRGAGDYPRGLCAAGAGAYPPRMNPSPLPAPSTATTLDAVIEALHGIGIAPEDIVTENLSVSPMYDYQYGKLGESQTVIGYQVENRLRVTVRDVNQVGAVMDAGVAAGANEAFGITFLSSNEADAADQALSRRRGGRPAQGGADGRGLRQNAGQPGFRQRERLWWIWRRDPEICRRRRGGHHGPWPTT